MCYLTWTPVLWLCTLFMDYWVVWFDSFYTHGTNFIALDVLLLLSSPSPLCSFLLRTWTPLCFLSGCSSVIIENNNRAYELTSFILLCSRRLGHRSVCLNRIVYKLQYLKSVMLLMLSGIHGTDIANNGRRPSADIPHQENHGREYIQTYSFTVLVCRQPGNRVM